jgi:hypothetical protein
MFNLFEGLEVIEAIAPQVANAGSAIDGDYISLKNAQMCWVVCHIAQANATVVTITIEVASAVAGTGHTVITNLVPIWVNLDCATASGMTRATDAANYNAGAGTTHKIVGFQIDPAAITGLANGDCIKVVFSLSHATNLFSAIYYILPRYKGAIAQMPSSILD